MTVAVWKLDQLASIYLIGAFSFLFFFCILFPIWWKLFSSFNHSKLLTDLNFIPCWIRNVLHCWMFIIPAWRRLINVGFLVYLSSFILKTCNQMQKLHFVLKLVACSCWAMSCCGSLLIACTLYILLIVIYVLLEDLRDTWPRS